MPIGKSSIKRVANNGYSKVSTSAPDMENSTAVVEEKTSQKKIAANKSETARTVSPAQKKSTASKPKATPEKKEKPAAVEKSAVAEKPSEEEKTYCNVGDGMPIFLL